MIERTLKGFWNEGVLGIPAYRSTSRQPSFPSEDSKTISSSLSVRVPGLSELYALSDYVSASFHKAGLSSPRVRTSIYTLIQVKQH
jgi:hypothetical protein